MRRFLGWFIDPVKNHYLDFKGRTSRQAYWMFVLVYICVMAFVALVETVLDSNFIGLFLMFALLLPTLGIAARRLHDTGLRGWWLMLGFGGMLCVAFLPEPSGPILSLVAMVTLIILLLRKGQPGINKYG